MVNASVDGSKEAGLWIKLVGLSQPDSIDFADNLITLSMGFVKIPLGCEILSDDRLFANL